MNSLSRKNKILLMVGIIISVLAIPLTIIQVQKQQSIRQHAAAIEDVSLYFADNENCATHLTTFPPASLSSSSAFYLCLAAGANKEGISGFNIALSAENLTFKSAEAVLNSQAKLDTQINNNVNTLILGGFVVDISHNVVDTPLPLLKFSVTALQNNGNVFITTTQINSLTQDSPLTVAKSSLSFGTGAPAPSTPTPAAKTPLTSITLGASYYCQSNEMILGWTLNPTNASITSYSILKAVRDENTGQQVQKQIQTPIPLNKTGFLDKDVAPNQPAGHYSYQLVANNGVFSDLTYSPETRSCQTQTATGTGAGGSPNNIFQCENQTGNSAGNYQCARIINDSAQCSSLPGGNWTESSRSYTSCDPQSSNSKTSACCKQGAAVPNAIPTSTPTPVNNVTLVLTLNAQDMPATTSVMAVNLPANLTLYNLTTNTQVEGAPATQVFAKTPIPGKQYAANVTLTDLPKDKYFIVARKDNMIAKTAFAVATANQTISIPTTTLVFGDITKDNDITALDWNALKDCWRKSTKDNLSCTAADFDQSGNVDQIDLNMLMRGWATWNEEGKIVNL